MIEIFVINLEHRKDRRDKILETYKDFKINIVEAIKHENGRIGCFMSHQKCLKIAKERNMKNIIVMEDDCAPMLPIEDFTKRLTNIKKYLDESDNWTIFLGGVFGINRLNIRGKRNTNCDNLYYINSGFCTHLIIYESNVYDFFINHDPTIVPIDRAWHNMFRAIIPIPFIATQDRSSSDISGNYTFHHRIKKSNNILFLDINSL